MNMIGRSIGKFFRHRLVSGGALRFKISSLAVIVAVTADFVFNRWDLEIIPYYRIRYIPWCVRYHAQSLRLES
jgi:hypothetical protein